MSIRFQTTYLAALVLAAGLVARTMAQVPPPSKPEPRLVNKVYSVADLVVPLENMPALGAVNAVNVQGQWAFQSTGNACSAPCTTAVHACEPQPSAPACVAPCPIAMCEARLPFPIPVAPRTFAVYDRPVGGYACAPVAPPAHAVSPVTSTTKATNTKQRTIEDTLIKLITNTVAPQSWSEVGGRGTIAFYPIGMGLVVSQTPEVQEQVAELLAALRHLQDEEVALECRFVTVPESMLERFTNCCPESCLTLGLCLDGSATRKGRAEIATEIAGKLSAAGPSQKSPIGLNDAEVRCFLEACQREAHGCVMQAPKVTLFNGQTANLSMVDQQFCVTGMNVRWNGEQVVAIPQQEPFETGLRMGVKAVISADRKYVSTELKVNLTELAGHDIPLSPVVTEILPVQEDGKPVQGASAEPVPFSQFIQKPKVNTVIHFDRTFKLPESKTAIVGAWKKTVEVPVECGPPILRDVPIVNWLFETERYEPQNQVVLLMVTPRVIVNKDSVKDRPASVKEQPKVTFVFGSTGADAGLTSETIINERNFVSRCLEAQLRGPPPLSTPSPEHTGILSKERYVITPQGLEARHPATIQVRCPEETPHAAPQPLPHPPQYFQPAPVFPLTKELTTAQVVVPEAKPAAATPEQDPRVVKLLTKYEKACAEGRKDDAKRFASQALKIDPTCFAKKPDRTSKTNEPFERIGVDFNFNPPIFFFGKEAKPLTPERVHGGIQ